MSMIDYVILGIAAEQPVSAYDMIKVIKMRNITKWVKISSPAVYKNAPKLLDKGYLSGRNVKEGEMAEKVVYTTTAAGMEYIQQLMIKYTAELGHFNLQFTPVLMNLALVDFPLGEDLILRTQKNIREELSQIQGAMAHLPPMKASSMKIVELYRDTYEYLDRWIQEFHQAYKEENSES